MKDDSSFSKALMLPFKILYPPIVNTPISTIRLPSASITMPLVLISYFIIVGGFVFCYVHDSPFYSQQYNKQGKIVTKWYADSIQNQVLSEGIVVSVIFSLGAISSICTFYAFTNKNTKTLNYKMIYRFGCTLPIWLLLAFEMTYLKLPLFPQFTL